MKVKGVGVRKSARLVIVCPSAICPKNHINRLILSDNCTNRMHGGDKEGKRPNFHDHFSLKNGRECRGPIALPLFQSHEIGSCDSLSSASYFFILFRTSELEWDKEQRNSGSWQRNKGLNHTMSGEERKVSNFENVSGVFRV